MKTNQLVIISVFFLYLHFYLFLQQKNNNDTIKSARLSSKAVRDDDDNYFIILSRRGSITLLNYATLCDVFNIINALLHHDFHFISPSH